MKEEEMFKIFNDYESFQVEYYSKFIPPKCHFSFMEVTGSDDETWYECRHCGCTKEYKIY